MFRVTSRKFENIFEISVFKTSEFELEESRSKKNAVVDAFEELERVAGVMSLSWSYGGDNVRYEKKELEKMIARFKEQGDQFKKVHKKLQENVSILKNKKCTDTCDDFYSSILTLERDLQLFTLQEVKPIKEEVDRYFNTRYLIVNKLIKEYASAKDFTFGVSSLFRSKQGQSLLYREKYIELVAKQPPRCAEVMANALGDLYHLRFSHQKKDEEYERKNEKECVEWLGKYSGKNVTSIITAYQLLLEYAIFDDEATCRGFLDQLFCEDSNKAREMIDLLTVIYSRGNRITQDMLFKIIDNRAYCKKILDQFTENYYNSRFLPEDLEKVIKDIKRKDPLLKYFMGEKSPEQKERPRLGR